MADVYKQMKEEKQQALEDRLRSSKDKASQEIASQARKMVRNIDPFER